MKERERRASPSRRFAMSDCVIFGSMALAIFLTSAATAKKLETGDILVSAAGSVLAIDPGTGDWETVASPGGLLTYALDVDADTEGRLLIADQDCCGTTGGILRIDPETGEQMILAAFDGLRPRRIVAGKDRLLYVGGFDSTQNSIRIVAVDLDTGAVSPFFGPTGVVSMSDLSVGTNGEICFVVFVDYFDGFVVEIDSETGASSIQRPFRGSGSPLGVAVDDLGDVFVSDPNARDPVTFRYFPRIARIERGTGNIETVARGFPLFEPSNLAFDQDGFLIVINNNLGFGSRPFNVLKVDPESGNQIVLAASPDWSSASGLAIVPTLLPILSIEIDIRPHAKTNRIHPESRGVIPVAILGSEALDVTQIEVDSLEFGPDAAPPIHGKRSRRSDINGDGIDDLVIGFPTPATGIRFGDTEACLSGRTRDDVAFSACEGITTVPTPKNRSSHLQKRIGSSSGVFPYLRQIPF